MKQYWDRHLAVDPAIAATVTALLWLSPHASLGPIWILDREELPDLLSRWLPGNLTLIGLIIATTGFLSSMLEKSEFAPLAKSTSIAQLWEILRQNLGWLFLSALYCYVGSLFELIPLVVAVIGSFVGLMVAISLGKLVWVMRSVLWVKIHNARRERSP